MNIGSKEKHAMVGLKVLVLYYSRSGATRKVAEDLAYLFNADCEEVKLVRDGNGPWAEFRGRLDAALQRPVELKPTLHDPYLYDLVIVGTPVWSNQMAAGIRQALQTRGSRFHTTAFFGLHDGCGGKACFDQMRELVNQEPLATFEVPEWEFRGEFYQDRLCQFVRLLRRRADLFTTLQSEIWSPTV